MRRSLPVPAGSVNPQLHDELTALVAVYYSEEISEEEWALLQIHLAYCESCHERFLEYQRITSEVAPAMAAAAASELDQAPRESAKSLEDAERRLIGLLNAPPSQDERPRRPKSGRHFSPIVIAACALLAACLFGVNFLRTKLQPSGQGGKLPFAQAPGRQAMPPSLVEDTPPPVSHAKQQVGSLERQVVADADRLKQASALLAVFKKQEESEQNTQRQLSEEKDRLSQQLAAAQAELDSMHNQQASAEKDAAKQAATAAAFERQFRELNAALDEKDVALSEKDRMLALDEDFLAHDRDIRDLIGARNLYIADIFDASESGKTAKQFGRIFYTKDRSLVFYGFDLDSQVERGQNVSFQVWGSGSDRPNPVSLGLFYQDDSHKRWVLRCSDAKTLARLDMVFVTVEPPGGSATPTGKHLLRAYLRIHPNHP